MTNSTIIIPRHLRRPFALVLYHEGELAEVIDVCMPRRVAERLAWEMEPRLPAEWSAAAVPMTWELAGRGQRA